VEVGAFARATVLHLQRILREPDKQLVEKSRRSRGFTREVVVEEPAKRLLSGACSGESTLQRFDSSLGSRQWRLGRTLLRVFRRVIKQVCDASATLSVAVRRENVSLEAVVEYIQRLAQRTFDDSRIISIPAEPDSNKAIVRQVLGQKDLAGSAHFTTSNQHLLEQCRQLREKRGSRLGQRVQSLQIAVERLAFAGQPTVFARIGDAFGV